MNEVLELFEELNRYKRCSGDTKEAFDFIVNFASKYTDQVSTDQAGNILVSIGVPKICLQSHYDMVCIGDMPPILVQEGDFLRAKNSTLGADNGIGVAMMLSMIRSKTEAEYLFTNDEEIGLIGANQLEVLPKSKKLLNLDSEMVGEITIGCAGGADFFLTKELAFEEKNLNFFEIASTGFAGGHSGVDIDKNIDSAIVELVRFIADQDLELCTISGGERINSIAVNARAIVATNQTIRAHKNFLIAPAKPHKIIKNSRELIDLISKIPHGVLRADQHFGVVARSANLALISSDEKQIKISVSTRGNTVNDLRVAENKIKNLADQYGFAITKEGKYPPWEPKETSLSDQLKALYDDPKISVIHAGLECAVLAKHLPDVEMASIGFTINYPHSRGEELLISTVKTVKDVAKKLISKTADQ